MIFFQVLDNSSDTKWFTGGIRNLKVTTVSIHLLMVS